MEPATKQDLKDLLKEFRESIKEVVAEAFSNSKPALKHATTLAASQLLSTDAPTSPMLAASAASAKPLDIDAHNLLDRWPWPRHCWIRLRGCVPAMSAVHRIPGCLADPTMLAVCRPRTGQNGAHKVFDHMLRQ